MVTIWIAITQFQNYSRMLQSSSRSPRIAQEPPLQPGYYSRNSTRTSKATDRVLFITQYQNTVQSYYSQNIVHEQRPLLFTQQCLDRIIEVTIYFRLKRYSPKSKSSLPSVIFAISWTDPRLPPAIKGTLYFSLQQVFLGLLSPKTQKPFFTIVIKWLSQFVS